MTRTPFPPRSPFPYQGPLEAELVTGREALVADLSQRVADRRLTALLGPRRYGKTSVLKKVAADLEGVGQHVVWIDLYELHSMADLAGAIDRGLAAASGPLRGVLDTVAGGLSIRLGVIGVELRKEKRQRPDPVLLVRQLLEVLVNTAKRQPLFVVFDEFAGIDNVSGAAGLLRTELQHHYRDLGIVFAGSQPSTMRTLFSDQNQPFFAQADLIEIGPLTDDAVVAIVNDGFEFTGRSAGNVARRVVVLASGHPQRAMQLSDAVWRATEEGATASDIEWEQGLQAVRQTVDLASERLFSLLSTGQQKTLRALASGGSIYGTAASVIDLAPGTARAAVDALIGNGFLVRRDGDLYVVDPMLADWLTRRFSF
ncbi:MAG: hypothetical protein ACI91O_000547 [Candidatus Poriferisodalaceae bacterium]